MIVHEVLREYLRKRIATDMKQEYVKMVNNTILACMKILKMQLKLEKKPKKNYLANIPMINQCSVRVTNLH